jgi:hypothetical protein
MKLVSLFHKECLEDRSYRTMDAGHFDGPAIPQIEGLEWTLGQVRYRA